MLQLRYVFRPHHPLRKCCKVGNTVNGVLKTVRDYDCPVPFQYQKWHKIRVVVNAEKATIYLDDQIVVTQYTTTHPTQPAVGVVVANGFDNIAWFKELKVEDV